MVRQFTATVYVIENQKVLLIFHRKLGKWLPPGGHVDPNELPSDAAIREAREETGLEVELIAQENIWIDRPNAKSFPRPFMCLLEEIPARPTEPAHQHIDLVYRGRTVGGQIVENGEEIDGLRWFSLEEMESLQTDIEIFDETKQTIRLLLSEELSYST